MYVLVVLATSQEQIVFRTSFPFFSRLRALNSSGVGREEILLIPFYLRTPSHCGGSPLVDTTNDDMRDTYFGLGTEEYLSAYIVGGYVIFRSKFVTV